MSHNLLTMMFSKLKLVKSFAIGFKLDILMLTRKAFQLSHHIELKVKLVAIAKDEAAYLPEWIFHHLYMGFDHINIYINNSNDNSGTLADLLAVNKSVSFIDGDTYFKAYDAPQIEIYKKELRDSRLQGYSHVMFLDIDEFWLSKDMAMSITDFIKEHPYPISCFEWLNRTSEDKAFLPPMDCNISGQRGRQVKSLISTSVIVRHINPHGVIGHRCMPRLANGQEFPVSLANFSKVDETELAKPIKDFYIMHRMYRSEQEYVALLTRGRPIKRADIGQFKGNRRGYLTSDSDTNVGFPEEMIASYQEQYRNFCNTLGLNAVIKDAREYILQKRFELVDKLKSAPKSEAATLKKILKRVRLEDVNQAYIQFKARHGIK